MTFVSNDTTYVNIKGTTFRNDQIASRSPENGKPTYNIDLAGTGDGKYEERYVVKLVDGTTVSLPEQTAESNARVIIAKDGTVHFDNIQGGTVFDTPRNDKYHFSQCNSVHVKAKRETERMFTQTSPSTFIPVYSQKVTLSEDNDKISTMFCSDIKVDYTESNDMLEKNGSIFTKK